MVRRHEFEHSSVPGCYHPCVIRNALSPVVSSTSARPASPPAARHDPAAVPVALLWLIFLACGLVYLATAGSNLSGDAYAELRVTQSLLGHGWFDVPQGTIGQTCGGWGCLGTHGRFYATHGIGYSLWLLPFYLLARGATAVLGDPHCASWAAAPHTTCVPVAIQLIAWNTVLLSAATVVLLCRLGLELGYGTRRSLAAALLYGFTSMAWPYSRFGFDVTLTGLLALAATREALLAASVATAPPNGLVAARRWLRCGVWLALAALVRIPTGIVALPFLALLVRATRHDTPASRVRAALCFTAPLLACLAFTCWYNWVRFGSPLADGHAGLSSEQAAFSPWVGLAGTLLSPGKGILWYNPSLLPALLAIPAFRRHNPAAGGLALSVAACSLLPYLFVQDWYGGESWGPRFVMPVLPLLFLPALQAPEVLRSGLARGMAVALALLGVALQLAGALVAYGLRLRLYDAHHLLDRTLWDPRYSPLGDQLGVLWGYATHLHDAARTTAGGVESFDVWWLTLWRNDGVPETPSLLAGVLIGTLAALSCCALAIAAKGYSRARMAP